MQGWTLVEENTENAVPVLAVVFVPYSAYRGDDNKINLHHQLDLGKYVASVGVVKKIICSQEEWGKGDMKLQCYMDPGSTYRELQVFLIYCNSSF